MRQLLQTLAAPLPQSAPQAAPFVYVTAISSNAGLTRSLAGIILISREMGFEREAETCIPATRKAPRFTPCIATVPRR